MYTCTPPRKQNVVSEDAWNAHMAPIRIGVRRKGIDSYKAANEYPEKEYLPAHNRPFAVPAVQPEDDHGRKPTARRLGEIFRL